MKIKWIIVTQNKFTKKYACWNDLYFSREDAEKWVKYKKKRQISEIWNWKKTKIFPIRWDSVENRAVI